MSRTLSTKAGLRDRLKVSLRCGCRSSARQTRETMVWLMPTRQGMACMGQCVVPAGCVPRMSVIIRSTASSSTWQGAPLQGTSISPSSRWKEALASSDHALAVDALASGEGLVGEVRPGIGHQHDAGQHDRTLAGATPALQTLQGRTTRARGLPKPDARVGSSTAAPKVAGHRR